jgi:hypothetical protein
MGHGNNNLSHSDIQPYLLKHGFINITLAEGYVSTNHSGSLGTQRRHRTLGFSPPKDLGILGFLKITWWRGTFNAEPPGGY